jgi:NitT/TauT family transport system substrate-binding protein
MFQRVRRRRHGEAQAGKDVNGQIKANSSISAVGQLRGKAVSTNAQNDIGTLLIDLLLSEHGIASGEVSFNNNVAFPGVATALKTDGVSASFAPEPFVSVNGELAGADELADLDQGSTQDFPIQGYAVTQAWAQNGCSGWQTPCSGSSCSRRKTRISRSPA